MGQTLGVGSFGKVKMAIHEPTGKKVAVKIMNKLKMKAINMYEKAIKEICILQSVIHPHIIRLYQVIDTPSDIYMVMEYVPGGELFDYIIQKGRLSEEEARKFFQQIISAMEYCNFNGICHRDLKPENIFLDDQCNIKIGDFGLSSYINDGDFLNTSCGSPNYAAPEVVSGKAYTGPEIDVWSCGVILYALLCGTLPFDDENVGNLFRKIRHGAFTIPGHISDHAKALISKMLTVDPSLRITYKEIRYNSWFRHNLPFYLEPHYFHLILLRRLFPLEVNSEADISDLKNSPEFRNKIINRILSSENINQGVLWAQKQRRHNRTHSVFSRQIQKKVSTLIQAFSNSTIRDTHRKITSLNYSATWGGKNTSSKLKMDKNTRTKDKHNYDNKNDTNDCNNGENTTTTATTVTNLYHNEMGENSLRAEPHLLSSSKLYSINCSDNITTLNSRNKDIDIGIGIGIEATNRSNNNNSTGRQSIFKTLYTKINKMLTESREREILEKRMDDISLGELNKGVEATNGQINSPNGRNKLVETGEIVNEKENREIVTSEVDLLTDNLKTYIQISSLPISPNINSSNGHYTANRWLLGFEVSGNLTRIIKIVLFTLKSSNYEWKFVTSHKLRCRPKTHNQTSTISSTSVTDDQSNCNNFDITPGGKRLQCGCELEHGANYGNEDNKVGMNFSMKKDEADKDNSSNSLGRSSSKCTHTPYINLNNVVTIQLLKINPLKYLIDIQIYDGPLLSNAFQAFRLTSCIYCNLLNNTYRNIFGN
ncbi:putative histone kinase SNF1 [Cryptosporidium felis]|nr:putative histone kinase SNF1 [Cryptosporidium felis]